MPQVKRTAKQILTTYRRMKPDNRKNLSIKDAWTIAQDPDYWTIGAHLTMRRLHKKATGVTWAQVRDLFEQKGREAVEASHLAPLYGSGSPPRREWIEEFLAPKGHLAKNAAIRIEPVKPKEPVVHKLPPPLAVKVKGPPPKKGKSGATSRSSSRAPAGRCRRTASPAPSAPWPASSSRPPRPNRPRLNLFPRRAAGGGAFYLDLSNPGVYL